jgi:mobilome CxxCx(11)CxxC protein
VEIEMTEQDQSLLRKCREKEFHAYGTTRIFERRARQYGHKRTLITYFGIAIPLVVGATAMAFGAKSAWFPYLLYAACVLGIPQLAISVWSVVDRWDEKYSEAIDSARGNTRLYNMWKRMADVPPANLQAGVEPATLLDQEQERRDLSLHVTDAERRFAMRESLFYYGKPCSNCGIIPRDKKPTNCDMCGNF